MSPQARWTVLGAGTAGPHPQRSPSGHLLQAPSIKGPVLIDMGAGTLWRLARAGVAWESLAAIFITHIHLDHCLDLPALMFAARGSHTRTEPLPIYASAGSLAFIEAMGAPLGKWFEPKGFEVQWCPIGPGEHSLAGLEVRAEPVAHHRTSLGLRFCAPGQSWSVAYSGDSDYCESLVTLCRGASLGVLECSTPEGDKHPGHMTPREVARVAVEAGLGRVALVHRYASLDGTDTAERVGAHGYSGEVIEAQDGTWFELADAP